MSIDARDAATATRQTDGDAAAPTARPRRPGLHWLWYLAGLGVTVAGFLGLDRWFYTHVSCVLNTEAVDRDFYHVTKPFWEICRLWADILGGALAYLAIFVLHRKGRLYANVALVAVLTAALVAHYGQRCIGRVRPNAVQTYGAFIKPFAGLKGDVPTSFPSGEAATAFAMACVLTRLFPRGRVAFYVAGTLAAAARLVNGAHFVSDVAAGAVLGALVAGSIMRLGMKHEARLLGLFSRRRPAP